MFGLWKDSGRDAAHAVLGGQLVFPGKQAGRLGDGADISGDGNPEILSKND